MAFDASAWLAAHYAPWSVTLTDHAGHGARRGPWTYEAREVSLVEVARFRERYAAATTPATEVRELKRFLRRLFPQVFWWTRPDPVELILKLPDDGRAAVLADFFAHRASRASRRPTPTSMPAAPSSRPLSGPTPTTSR